MTTPTPGDLSARLQAPMEAALRYIQHTAAGKQELLERQLSEAIAALSALPAAGEPVGEVIEGFTDAMGGAAYVVRWHGRSPKLGTKLYTTPQPSAAEGVVKLRVTTRDPDKYTLHNSEDGSYWRGTTEGTWVRATPPTDAAECSGCSKALTGLCAVCAARLETSTLADEGVKGEVVCNACGYPEWVCDAIACGKIKQGSTFVADESTDAAVGAQGDGEAAARAAFEQQAKGWRNAIPWDELHDDTRKLWRDFVARRAALSAAPAVGKGVDKRIERFTEANGKALRAVRVGEVLTDEQWEAVCAFVREQDGIIAALQRRMREDRWQAALTRQPVAGFDSSAFIRFDFESDGRIDSKLLTHDEMRQRYADAARQPVAGDGEVAGWTLQVKRDGRDGEMGVWAVDSDGTSIWIAPAATPTDR